MPEGDPEALLSELARESGGGPLTGPDWETLADRLDTAGARWVSAPAGAGARLARRTVLGGLATAVADGAARRAGLPLGAWAARGVGAGLGTAADQALRAGPSTVPLYADLNRAVRERTPRAAAEPARRAAAAGFRSVRCAPFDGLPPGERMTAGLDIVRAVRKAVGDGIQVLLNAHHRVTVDELLAHRAELAELRLGWLEDATRLDDVAGLRRLRDGLGVPSAGGAGNFFTAGYFAARLAGCGPADCLATATRVAAWSVAAEGDREGLPTAGELALADAPRGTVTR